MKSNRCLLHLLVWGSSKVTSSGLTLILPSLFVHVLTLVRWGLRFTFQDCFFNTDICRGMWRVHVHPMGSRQKTVKTACFFFPVFFSSNFYLISSLSTGSTLVAWILQTCDGNAEVFCGSLSSIKCIRAQNLSGLRVFHPQISQNSPFEKYLIWQNIHNGAIFGKICPK